MSSPDKRCLVIARKQHGVIARCQAMSAGLSERQIHHRVSRGLWIRRHRGIYVIAGTPRSWDQDVWAAYLALAPHAVASHRAAAAIWEFDGMDRRYVDLTLPYSRRVQPVGAIVHRARELPSSHVRTRKGLRVTSPDRTLLDLAAVAPVEILEPALDSALRRQLTAIPRLQHVLAGAKGRKGARALRRLQDERDPEERPSESWLESRLFAILREVGLPAPDRQVEVVAGGRHIARLDFAYPDLKVGLEAVGYRFHGDQPGWHADLARRNDLMVLGWRILYFAWLDVRRRREDIRRQVQQLVEEASGIQRLVGVADYL